MTTAVRQARYDKIKLDNGNSYTPSEIWQKRWRDSERFSV